MVAAKTQQLETMAAKRAQSIRNPKQRESFLKDFKLQLEADNAYWAAWFNNA